MPDSPSRAGLLLLICALLVVVTAAAYWQSLECGFIKCFDDEIYVTDNYHLTQGFARGLRWAFTTYQGANWHPVTWISHLTDYSLYDLDPAGHHLTSLLLHIANMLLLFLVLTRMTGAVWKSGFVAALFAVHPLHVESVAWVAERKDVLSTFFWLATMYAYILYTKRPGAVRYLAVVVAYGLGLMAKPMLVSVPLVLLLVDYWPLGRVSLRWRLVWEKLPLAAMAAASSVITVIAQRAGGAVAGLEQIPPAYRLANAAVSYAAYMWKMIWPGKLAAFYPHLRTNLPVWEAVGAGLVLAAITILALRAGRRRPYLAVGWLWYVITLAPVIGLVQVGSQAMADRYTYVPLIGLFVMIAWGVPDLLTKRTPTALSRPEAVSKRTTPTALSRRPQGAVSKGAWLGAIAIALVIVLAALTWVQVGYWRNPYTLFGHAIKVTRDNALAYDRIGITLEDKERYPEAIKYLAKAVELGPEYGDARMALGRLLIKSATNPDGTMDTDKVNEGMSHLLLALKLGLNTAEEHQNLAFGYYCLGQLDTSADHCLTALALDPKYAPSENTLASVRFNQFRLDAAISLWQSAAEHDPTYGAPHANLAFALLLKGDYRAAWDEVHRYKALGGEPDPKLIRMLSAKMQEPR